MKICPKCKQTYSDESLNFCLSDGSILSQIGFSADETLPETLIVNQSPRPTNPNQQPGEQQFFQNSWDVQPQPHQFLMARQQKGGGKTWIWPLGIVGLLALICGGGLIGFLAFVGSPLGNKVNNKVDSPTPAKINFNQVDMGAWKTGSDEYARTEYSGGVFTVETFKDSVYYVIVAPAGNKTQNKTARVTVKNIERASVTYGFGLLVHSNTTPLVADYGFLIDSEKKRYRVVQHSLKTEKEIVKWTPASAIKGGTEENLLEVRDSGDRMQFYVNGKYITTVDDAINNSDGVAGIYASDGIPIKFSKLEIER